MKQQVWGKNYIDELVQVGLNDHSDVDDPTGNVCRRFFWACQDANCNVLGLVNRIGLLTERYEYSPYGERKVFSRGCSAPLGCVEAANRPGDGDGREADAQNDAQKIIHPGNSLPSHVNAMSRD